MTSWTSLLAATLLSTAVSAATVSGTVRDETGATPPLAGVVALDADTLAVLTSHFTQDGDYTLELTDGTDAVLVAVALSGNQAGGYHLHEHTIAAVRLQAVAGARTQDLTVHRCREYVLERRRADGALVRNGEEHTDEAFLVDDAGEATTELLLATDQGSEETAVPAICVPLGERRQLILRATLPGAGLLNLPVAPEGGYFTAGAPGGEVVDLDLLLADSQLARLAARLAAAEEAGAAVPPEHRDRLTNLQEAREQAADLAPDGARAAALTRVAADAVLALEALVLWQARAGAEELRQGGLRVAVVDATGDPVPGARVAWSQVTHDFLFGVFEHLQSAGEAGFARLRAAGLNGVTGGFYWSDIEPVEGEVRWDHLDHEIGVRDLAAAGWRMKGHPLTWLYDLLLPDYAQGLPVTELTELSVDHVTRLVAAYRDVVPMWDVSNEASTIHASGGLTREEMDAYLVAVFAAARAADPGATLILNSHFDRYGVARKGELLDPAPNSPYSISVPAFVRRTLAAGADVDALGQQLYNGGTITLFAQQGVGPVMGIPSHDLGFLADTLEELAGFGRPVYVTEQSVGSTWEPEWEEVGAGYWHAPWTAEVQADFVEAFYRLCFGAARVRGVTWWNALDPDAFVVGGGLLHADGTAKPALLRLESLIRGEWSSQGEATTDAGGAVALRGFAGEYELVVTPAEGAATIVGAHVVEQEDGQLQVVVDPTPVETEAGAGEAEAAGEVEPDAEADAAGEVEGVDPPDAMGEAEGPEGDSSEPVETGASAGGDGCGCGAASTSGGPGPGLLLLVVPLRRRRRQV